MPFVERQLAGSQGGSLVVSVLKQFEQVTSVFGAKLGHAPVVKDEDIGFSQSCQEFGVTTIALGDSQAGEESD